MRLDVSVDVGLGVDVVWVRRAVDVSVDVGVGIGVSVVQA